MPNINPVPDHADGNRGPSQADDSDRRSVPVPTGSAYAQLAMITLGQQPLGTVLEQIAQAAADHVPGITQASITLMERDRPRSVAFSGDLAAALDERQYEAGF